MSDMAQGEQVLSLVQRLKQPSAFEKIVWPYRFMIPILFLSGAYVQTKKALYRLFGGRTCIPRFNLWFVDLISINSRRVKDGAARWLALDAVYNFRGGEGSNKVVRAIDEYWLHIRNAQAVRNRLKIVKRELSAAILKIAETKDSGEPVRILSLAAGSGQGVIEVVAEFARKGVLCEVILVDQDESALQHASALAREAGIDQVVVVVSNVVSFLRNCRNVKFDIIEMCGLMDYLEDDLAVAVIKMVNRRLTENGYFLTCHIHPNLESYFLWHVVNWGMLYRTRWELRLLLVRGGFLLPVLHSEPHRIHSVAVVQKKA